MPLPIPSQISSTHRATVADNSPELLARVVMHHHTENDKLTDNPDKNGLSRFADANRKDASRILIHRFHRFNKDP